MGIDPCLALGWGCALPRIGGRRAAGQQAPQGVQAHLPVVAGVEAAPPAGAMGTVEIPV